MLLECLVITEVTREVTWGAYGQEPWRAPFRPAEMTDYFPTPLSWRSFGLGASDHDITADEVYCPCDATVRLPEAPDAALGDFVDAAEAHIAGQHPGARRAS